MNKKRLSVVMAGAMLASSVAPVLAAEEVPSYELQAGQTGLLKNGLRELLESKKFHKTDKSLAGQSVYYYTIGLNGGKQKSITTQLDKLAVGTKVYVWSEGFREDANKNYFSTADTAGEEVSVGKYTEEKLADEAKKITADIKAASTGTADQKKIAKVIKTAIYNNTSKELVITLKDGREFNYNTNSDIVDFTKPVDSQGYEVDPMKVNDTPADDKVLSSIVGFKNKVSQTLVGADLPGKKLAEVVITNDGRNLKVEDLYDGLMLTEKGHDLLSEVKAAKTANVTKVYTKYGVSTFKVTLTDKFGTTTEYTITGSDVDNATILQDWLAKKHATVDILAGDDRYETAVKIAKETALIKELKDVNATVETSNIVLVNGNSLVDGLSAAPLAAKLSAQGSNTVAPILLTEKDSLPRATKNYLKELLSKAQIGNLGKIRINIVGGNGVISKSLERELKSLGFDVERFGGENREETSMAVAEEIGFNNSAFVVGANGEADAMSVAAVAAKAGSNNQTPIIVSNFDGLSEDTTYELRGLNVSVIGGDSVVSEEEYEAIEDVAAATRRIYGSDRKATNAKVIDTFYGKTGITGVKSVLVAKDDVLIDALTAANLASVQNAPVVLATNSLSNEQINVLELKAKDADNVYQIGHGVAPSVIKTVANRLGLPGINK